MPAHRLYRSQTKENDEMETSKKQLVGLAAVAALFLSTGCSATGSTDAAQSNAVASAPMAPTALTGAQEVPPNTSTASGKNMVVIGADKSVTGSVQVTGMTATMAHIHEAPKGSNGPVIVPLTKTGDMTFAPGPGAKLTDAQYASYKAGKLYINVHSAAYPGGEVRLQLRPAL
jgi:hypothetical protein